MYVPGGMMDTDSAKTKQITFRVAEPFHRELRMRCLEEDIPMSGLIRGLLSMWLDREIELSQTPVPGSQENVYE